VVSAVVRRALGKGSSGDDAAASAPEEAHAAADALFGGATSSSSSSTSSSSSSTSSSSSVIVVLGTQLRTGDLRSGAVMAPLNALVRRSGSAAVLPHVAHEAAAAAAEGGCRAKAAARLQAAAAGVSSHVFGCGASVDSAASASEAAAVLAAAGWTAGSRPLLLIACTPDAGADGDGGDGDGERAAAKGDDARAMAAAHDALAAALGEGAAHVGVLAVRPRKDGERRRCRGRSLQQHQQQRVDEVVAGAAEVVGGGLGAAAAAAARPSLGANGQYDTCDARCQSQVKWLQGIMAAGVMTTALVGGLTSLNALQGPSRFEKPDRE